MIQFERLSEIQIEQLRTDPTFNDVGKYAENVVVESLAHFVPPAFLYLNPILRENVDEQQAGWELTDVVFWYEVNIIVD